MDVVLNATSFAIVSLAADGADPSEPVLLAGDAPVLQLITAGGTREQWQDDPHGLTPRDLAMLYRQIASFNAVDRHSLTGQFAARLRIARARRTRLVTAEIRCLGRIGLERKSSPPALSAS